MTEEQRESRLQDGVLEGDKKVGKLTLRPFTFGSLQASRKMGLTMFTGDMDEDASPLEGETQEQADTRITEKLESEIIAFGWLQSAPFAEVMAALRNDTAWEKVDEWAFSLDVDTFHDLAREIERMGKNIDAAGVETTPKQKDTGDGDPPPGKS